MSRPIEATEAVRALDIDDARVVGSFDTEMVQAATVVVVVVAVATECQYSRGHHN